MQNFHVFLLCMLGAAFLSSVLSNNANGPDNCCFKYYPRRMNKNLFRSYEITDDRCPKIGVILVTLKSRTICVDPNLTWVEGIMRHVDESSF
ncbi:C-C motif chemokine 8 [Notolabrus celidotus]|uniref:C-C motif chemokine 8 n=1 Tax=Notolabrus celidotus TaxID=1203425 RepID=UPI00148FE1BB|nr:C-C motif chemokine 8 [Notolabrus celidotus]